MAIFEFILLVLLLKCGDSQVLQFGACPEVKTVKFFDIERFLGTWHVIARYPAWFEENGHCAYKRVQACGRRVRIDHAYTRDGVLFVLHVNSTYNPGDEAVFEIQENSVDPVGVPLSVVATDYDNYAIIYGCKVNSNLNIKYTLAWILSREKTLSPELTQSAFETLNDIPFSSPVYLETVNQEDKYCSYFWIAHVDALNTDDLE